MARSRLPAKGSAHTADIFLAVGTALSWWEASEDALMGLFKRLCGELEPTAFETYVRVPRAVRTSMLKSALIHHAARLIDGEADAVHHALKRLDRLAVTRNEIAHGFVGHHIEHQNGELVAEGNYLLPSYNERGPLVRDFRFHHTAGSIRDFEDKVRTARWEVVEIERTIAMRQQAQMVADADLYMQWEYARRIAWREVAPAGVARFMRAPEEWSRKGDRD